MHDYGFYKIRPFLPTDYLGLHALAQSEGMDDLDDWSGVHVAVNPENEVVGFISVEIHDSAAYVHPVAVHSTWRGNGVGRALMECAWEKAREINPEHPTVAFVARGSSVAFYRALGFAPTSFENMPALIANDCKECELYKECDPLPMVKHESPQQN